MTISTISAADFTQLLTSNEDLPILDIRSELEYKNMRLGCPVIHTPMHNVTPDIERNMEQPLFILCKMGPRAQQIALCLAENGHENLVVIDGGILGCRASSAPIIEQDPPADDDDIADAVQQSVQQFMMRPSLTMS